MMKKKLILNPRDPKQIAELCLWAKDSTNNVSDQQAREYANAILETPFLDGKHLLWAYSAHDSNLFNVVQDILGSELKKYTTNDTSEIEELREAIDEKKAMKKFPVLSYLVELNK